MAHKIKNIYFNIDENYPPEELKEKVLYAYEHYPKVRMIFDLDGVKVSNIGCMKKVKKVFEEIGVEKLVETCVYSKEKYKLMLVKQFLKLVKTERPVRYL